MDTLAYTHLAIDYQPAIQSTGTSLPSELGLSDTARSPHAVGYSRVKVLSAVVCLSILGFASSAMALLQRGDSGDDVTKLQEALKQKGYFTGSTTGFFGEITEAAVIQFQTAKGLEADGIVGSATESALSTGISNTSASGTSTGASGGSAIASSGTLQQGDEGDAVTSLQTALKKLNYYDGPITGFFGPLTEEAVIRFQQAKGLTADGVVGPQTLAALSGGQSTGGQPNNQGSGVPIPISTGGTTTTGGTSSNALADLQTKLNTLGYYFGSIDGIYGPQTERAIRDFQSANGLNPDGFLGPETQAKLNAVYQAKINPPANGGSGSSLPPPTTPAPNNPPPVQPPVIVGKLPYVVVVPITDNATLTSVRQIVPGAVLSDSRLGKYANAGTFADRAGADSVSRQLRAAGLDARVAYFP